MFSLHVDTARTWRGGQNQVLVTVMCLRALGHRVMWGIGRVSTITPQALVTSALLAWRGRGIGAKELGERVGLLRRLAAHDGTPVSSTLKDFNVEVAQFGVVQRVIQAQHRTGMPHLNEPLARLAADALRG